MTSTATIKHKNDRVSSYGGPTKGRAMDSSILELGAFVDTRLLAPKASEASMGAFYF
jgi:hypothetical protein